MYEGSVIVRLAGIVAEYNPFHNGHKYQIDMTRQAGATHVVAIMSGNFLQRGAPALIEKRARAKAALMEGVDLVIELPLPYAVATAERFAYGALSLIGALGTVDMLSFGSECGDVDLLVQTARAIDDPRINSTLSECMSVGNTFAKARQEAVKAIYGTEVASVLEQPNNTLGVEYIRQILKLQLPIMPVTVKRAGAGHDSDYVVGGIASASHIRTRWNSFNLNPIAPYVPLEAFDIYDREMRRGLGSIDMPKLENAMMSYLRRVTVDDIVRVADISEGLENRVLAGIRDAANTTELYSLIKTKRYTMSRVRRIIMNTFLQIDGDMCQKAPPYIRVLGLNERGMEILANSKETVSLPISDSLAKLRDYGGECSRYAILESKSTDQYTFATLNTAPCGYDYTAGSVIIK